MKRKSKLLTFILSTIPGLGHIYLGLIQRGLMFLVAAGFIFLSGIFTSVVLHIFFEGIPFIILIFVWFAAVVDSLVLNDRINQKLVQGYSSGEDSTQILERIETEMKGQNGKILALALSIVPGAGHMYIGQMEKGLQLMAGFFLTLYLSDFLSFSLLLMAAPLLWFYSIFDIMHKVNQPEKEQSITYLGSIFRENQLSGKAGKYLGIALIIIGCLMVLNKIVMPQIEIYLDSRVIEFIKTGIIAILFIAGGVRLMMGSRKKEIVDGGSVENAYGESLPQSDRMTEGGDR
ncbi:hypothetical protein LPY66_15865 [Dehalobacter sp. DCM]|uniref:hypothetical protein n=1 Tax=Dehalobacter sp. DCM TaxID=2907827 RepID=UPI003081D462|nr:hypothetical protein LPY66_15865 [Dehalobacter sp. DCM]